MGAVRSFIAVNIPDELREQISGIQEQLRQTGERVSWTKPGNLHITLRFLGDVEEKRIDELAGLVTRVAGMRSKFSVSLNEVGAFPNLRRPRVLWIGIQEGAQELKRLAVDLENGLAKIGFPREARTFSAHLTIGRVKARVREPFGDELRNIEFQSPPFPVEEICLMRSQLHPAGAIYTPLKVGPFASI